MGMRRLLRYFALRLVRLSAAVDSVARGIACGVTVSFFPVFGIHALMGMAMAFVMRGNVLAAAIGSLIVPPVILPVLFSLDFLVGRKILRAAGLWDAYGWGREESFQQATTTGFAYISTHFEELFVPAFVGSVLFMLLAWPAAYMASHKLLEALNKRHKRRKYKNEAA